MDYGYARASTNSDKQDIGRQKRELIAIGIKVLMHILIILIEIKK